MEQYSVSNDHNRIIIAQERQSFRMSVLKDSKVKSDSITARLEAILYKEEGVFIPDARYVFEALDKNNLPKVDGVNLEHFNAAVDFFFNTILNTELYVKSTPRTSSFCSKDRQQFKFD